MPSAQPITIRNTQPAGALVRASMPRRAMDQTDTQCEIARAMGPIGWRRLDPAIRRRFGKLSAHSGRVTYHGAMRHVRCSGAGMLLAQFSRLIGTPLAPYRGRDIKTSVLVYPDAKRGGLVWDRRYAFPGKATVSVRSTKLLDANDRLLECVGGGFGMVLRVFEADGALHFMSQRYFWDFFGLRIYLPDFLTPGQAHVVHTDLGGGLFRFQITICHRQLGETFFQVGEFRDLEDDPEA